MAQIVIVDDAKNNIPIKGRLSRGKKRLCPNCKVYKTTKPYNIGKYC